MTKKHIEDKLNRQLEHIADQGKKDHYLRLIFGLSNRIQQGRFTAPTSFMLVLILDTL